RDVQAVGGGACEEPDERIRRDVRKADDSCLRRGVRQAEDKQGIGDRCRRRARGREALPELEQDEVPVLPERRHSGIIASQAAAASSASTASSRRRVRRYVAAPSVATVMIAISSR